MIIYVENPKEVIKKLPKLSKYVKFAEYKVNLHKSIVFLYSSDE